MSSNFNSLTGEMAEGGSDDANKADIGEHLGARHKDNFGYTTTGAEINDSVLAEKGGHPKHFGKNKQPGSGESRIHHFNHGALSGVVGGIVG